MTVVSGGQAPYAPKLALIGIIQGYRTRGWAPPFTLELVQRAGVTASLSPRVLQALRLLDLIDDAGMPTPAFEGLRRVPQPEYPAALAAILKAAYAEVFQFIDPATDPEDRIQDIFRAYEPLGQMPRMVSLFLGLCVEAELRSADVATNRAAPRVLTPRTRKAPTSHEKIRSGLSRLASGNTTPYDRETDLAMRGLPPALAGLLASLPRMGGSWTPEERARFLALFPATLDFCYPVSTAVIESGVVDEDAE